MQLNATTPLTYPRSIKPPEKQLVFATSGFMLIFSVSAPTQQLVWERIGTKNATGLGWWLAPAGDVNGDGYEDLYTLVVTVVAKSTQTPQLWTLSGKDGTTLRIRKPSAYYRFIDSPTGVGDMDGDKVPDYAVRLGDSSHRALPSTVEVRSGKTDVLLWQASSTWESRFGSSILGDLDLDGDGKPDIVIAARDVRAKNQPWYIGAVYAYSNKGKLLYKLEGNLSGLHIGLSLAKIGDLDRDGKDDYIIGTNGYPPNGYGQAMVVSGATGKTLVTGIDKSTNDHIGYYVTGVGDVNGDGVPDFAAAGGGAFSYQVARVFSGKDGRMLYKLFGPGRSSAISSRGLDLDRDGVADLVVGAPGAKAPGWNVGSVFAFSLRDGTELHRVNSDFRTVGSSSMGQMVTTLRSPPGSPFAQFAFSQPRFGSDEILGSLGRIAVYQGSPAGVKVFGTTCRGTLKTAPKIGIRDLGKKGIRLQLSGGAPASPAALLLGLSRTRWGNFSLPLALDPFGFTGCKLYTSIELLLLTSTGSMGISKGYGFLDLPIQLFSTGKLTLHGQWMSLGAGKLAPGALSDAILLRLR